MRINCTLEDLLITDNNIGSKGAEVLAEALTRTPNNFFECKEIKEFADALQTNSTLEDLLIMDNNIGSEGAEVLAEALTRTQNKLF
ncbi:hypothetical protein C2G38_2229742 [Gigaspora rosea]|uniref:Uncharacterized protein n=1 Tax=Gigaspora rosea TaxID=44941 RepID=A0A397TVC2_9GLOM|nr:hypothetical protein C2G38_2229742 [Gigaspora rosea]